MGQKIQCNNCKDIIESKSRHDFVTCSCFTNSKDNKGIYVDGGDDYCRIGGDPNNMTFIDDEDKIYTVKAEEIE